MFVKELGTPNNFFINLLINRSIVSIFVSDPLYICNGHANLYIYIYIYIYVCVCVCVYISEYIYTYIHTDIYICVYMYV